MRNIKLEPCPFCGFPPIVERVGLFTFAIYCPWGRCESTKGVKGTKKSASKLWNKLAKEARNETET